MTASHGTMVGYGVRGRSARRRNELILSIDVSRGKPKFGLFGVKLPYNALSVEVKARGPEVWMLTQLDDAEANALLGHLAVQN